MNTLILTGCGHWDYSVSAALLLHALDGQADVFKCSKRRLPEFLDSCAEKRWTRIYLLGISLLEDLDALCAALEVLKKKEVAVTWISTLSLPENVLPRIEKRMEVKICCSNLTEAVATLFSVEDTGPYFELLTKKDERTQKYRELVAAAEYYDRNYQDEDSNGEAIRLIASFSDPAFWNFRIKQMVSHFKRFGNRELVGKSEAIVKLQEQINQVAPHTDAWVLIWGESGTGKETVAQQIHNKSPRRDEPFIPFNCASVNSNLLESRFFGYEKGTFTGAENRRIGLFEQADGGTLFLDEIGELPIEAQSLLLRVLEGGRFMRLGGTKEISVDVRMVCATHRNLPALVRAGKFRADLYYRISVIQMRIPPLREHKEDIASLADSWRWKHCPDVQFTADQISALEKYDYPGNVRELFNLLERAKVMEETDFDQLLKDHWEINTELKDAEPKNTQFPDNLEAMIRLHVRRVYEAHDQNLTQTAKALDVSRNTVKKYLQPL